MKQDTRNESLDDRVVFISSELGLVVRFFVVVCEEDVEEYHDSLNEWCTEWFYVSCLLLCRLRVLLFVPWLDYWLPYCWEDSWILFLVWQFLPLFSDSETLMMKTESGHETRFLFFRWTCSTWMIRGPFFFVFLLHGCPADKIETSTLFALLLSDKT